MIKESVVKVCKNNNRWVCGKSCKNNNRC
jgi:hypothetical protein